MSLGPVLRKVQRNQVLQVLTDAGLDPSEFSWDQLTYTDGYYRGPAELLSHRDGEYGFEFRLFQGSGSRHHSRMRPGPESVEAFEAPGDWMNQLSYVRRWADDVRAELDAPDLWESASSWSSLRDVPPTFESNSNFTQTELPEVHARLEELRQRLKELSSDETQAAIADQVIDYLKVEARKQGRRNWFFMALGALMSLMADAAFDPTRAKEIIDFLIHGMRGLGGG